MDELHILDLQRLPDPYEDQRQRFTLMQPFWQDQAMPLAVVDVVGALWGVCKQPRLRREPQVLCRLVLFTCTETGAMKRSRQQVSLGLYCLSFEARSTQGTQTLPVLRWAKLIRGQR